MVHAFPEHYDPHMTVRQTQEAIKFIRDLFQKEFGREMGLERISAPLFVSQASGLNDNLNGVERPVAFDMKSIPGETFEVVQSLAKWKRMALGQYGFEPGEGLYTNMNAIRRDEDLDELHSCYVDQWDWEMVITREDRNEQFLEGVVRSIFRPSRTISSLSQPKNWKRAGPTGQEKKERISSPKNTAPSSSAKSAALWRTASRMTGVRLTMTTGA